MGKSCPGYRDLDPLIFRPYRTEGDDSKSEASASERSAGVSSTSREGLAAKTPDIRRGASAGPSSGRREVSAVLSPGSKKNSSAGRASHSPQRFLGPPSWDHQAVSCYMGQYTFSPSANSSSFGWFDFLPDYLIHASDDSPLRPTVQAISYASLAGQSSLKWLLVEARRYYGQALSKINAALRRAETAVEDDVLASVILAGFYENVSGDNLDIMGSHREGVSMLVKLRGDDQFSTERGRSLFRHACSMYRLFAYNTGTRPIPILQAYRGYSDPSASDSRRASGMVSVTADRIASIAAEFKDFYTSPHASEEFAEGASTFLSRLEAIQDELIGHMEVFDPNWRGFRFDSIPGITDGPQPAYVLTYPELWKMSIANLSRVILVKVNEMLYLCHSALADPTAPLFPDQSQTAGSSPRATACAEAVRRYIDEMLATVPYILDDIDASGNIAADRAPKSGIKAFLSIWSLWIAKSAELADRTQVAYAETALKRVANSWGIQLAAHVWGLKMYDRYGVMHAGFWR